MANKTHIDYFVAEMLLEHNHATTKFPGSNCNLAALTEETGELAQALLHLREGKTNIWTNVWREAIQVAVMALRVATEGDPTILDTSRILGFPGHARVDQNYE